MFRIQLLFTLLCLSNPLSGQQFETSFNHYGIEDGLSHNQIRWMHKDSRGMLWFGGANGINRYDGKTFKLVAEVDFFSVKENKSILEDREGDLWLYKNYWKSELFFFNIHSQQTRTFEEKFGPNSPFQQKDFNKGIALADGSLIIRNSNDQLLSYDSTDGFTDLTSDFSISNLHAIPETNEFWLEYYQANSPSQSRSIGLFQKTKTNGLQKVTSFEIALETQVIGVTKEKSLLLLTKDHKNYMELNPNGQQTIVDISFLPQYDHPDRALFLDYDREQDRFINCTNGITTIFSRTNKDEVFVSKKYADLKSTLFYCHKFEDNILWIGTMSGINKIQIVPSLFEKLYYHDPLQHNPEEMRSFRFIDIDSGPGRIKHPPIEFQQEKKLEFWTQYKDENDRTWLGGFYGIYYFDPGDTITKRLEEAKRFGKVPTRRVYHFFKDQEQQHWVCAANGLFQLDLKKGLVNRYAKDESENFLPATDLRHMHQDKEGIFWIASFDGLIRWDRKNNQHRLYTTDDGLSNNHIMAVYEDDFGFLWMSSDNGIMQFEKSTGRVKVYLPEDGVTHREFNRNAHFRNTEGKIYFGSLNGITAFHPKNFVEGFHKKPDIPLLLTECQLVAGKTNEQESRLKQYNNEQRIVLQPGDQHLQLKFALLDYANNNPSLVQYICSVDQEKEWNINNDNSIHFNNLSYGNHTLNVKARTSNGLISKQTLSIPISVIRPFHAQAWFKVLCVLAVACLLFLIQRLRTRALVKRKIELENIVRLRTKTIQNQAKELRQLDKAKSRFLANISHEFRTPLTLILNTLNEEQVDKLSHFTNHQPKSIFTEIEIDILHRNTKRLHQLINQLLDLAKLESKKMSLNEAPDDFSIYLKGLINSFIPLSEKKKILLQSNIYLNESKLYFDRDKIDKIIYNLLSNAIKFTPSNGLIQVSVTQNETDTIIEVKDSGIGISTTDQAHIFDRFYQTNQPNDYTHEGTGLGLALVKELVDVYKGSLQLESELGEGCRFKISLPLRKATDFIVPIRKRQFITETKESQKEYKLADTTIPPGQSNNPEAFPTLLIIEDNEDLLFHHQKTYAKKYQLITATDGNLGIEKAFEHIPDLIICDIMMPGKNGYEVCYILKNDERTNHIPLILLTAKVGHNEKIEGLLAGADDYITKPYDQRELTLRITNILDHNAQIRKQFATQAPTLAPIIKKSTAPTPQEKFILKLSEAIDKNLDKRNFGVEELSAEVNLSRSQLFRKLKALTGGTPNNFLRTYRLNKAKELLVEEEGNATSVAYLTGFSSPNYFFKCFKDEFGLTPGQYMEELQQQT